MTILEDTNQKIGKHTAVNKYFEAQNIDIIRQRLPCGDYVLANEMIFDVLKRKQDRGIPVKMMDLMGTYDVCVDEKFSIQELVGDVCGRQHSRFRDELILAKNNGIKLVVLVENNHEIVYNRKGRLIENQPIRRLEDLHKWVNPRLWIFQSGKQKYPTATKGITLQKACATMRAKYGVEFMFCTTEEAGENIVRILSGEI